MAAKKHPFGPDYCIICDDIRRENNGKLILIGVYTYVLVAQSIPGAINLVFVCKTDDVPSGVAVNLRVTGPDGKPIMKMGPIDTIEVPSDQPSFGSFRVPIAFSAVGKHHFEIVNATGKKVYASHPFEVRREQDSASS